MADKPTWFNAIPQTTGSTSPESIGFSHGGGSLSQNYRVGPDKLNQFIYYTLGFNAKREDQYSGVYRETPLAHPQFPFCYASSIAQITGQQYMRNIDNEFYSLGAGSFYSARPFPTYPEYFEYDISVNYEPKPYVVLDDDTLINRVGTLQFVDINNRAYVFPNLMPEWFRFTTITYQPKAEYLTFDIGQNLFYAPNNTFFNSGILRSANTGMYKQLYKSATVKLKWHCVPYFYQNGIDQLTNIKYKVAAEEFQGRINSESFFGFPAGSLLLESFDTVNVYNQATLTSNEIATDPVNANRKFFKNNLLCDIEFVFQYRYDNETENYANVRKTNLNQIFAGHNLFRRAASNKAIAIVRAEDINTTTGKIKDNALGLTYASAPMQLLFTNPSYFSNIYR